MKRPNTFAKIPVLVSSYDPAMVRMWRAFLDQMVEDTVKDNKTGERARTWLQDRGENFYLVCELACLPAWFVEKTLDGE